MNRDARLLSLAPNGLAFRFQPSRVQPFSPFPLYFQPSTLIASNARAHINPRLSLPD